MMMRIFQEHPAKVGESYFEHMAFAFGFGWRLVRAGCAAFLHGVVPACCETTASTQVLAMSNEIQARRALMNSGQHDRAADRRVNEAGARA